MSDELFTRAERVAAYAALVLLLVSELVARFVEPVRTALEGGGAIIFLAIALLLVFRLVDRHLLDVNPSFRRVAFSDGVRAALGSGKITQMRIFAFDGATYYEFVSERTPTIDRLQILVVSTNALTRWTRLVENGIARNLELRQCHAGPVFHYCVCDGETALFGPLLRVSGGVETGRHFLVTDSSSSTVALIDNLRAHFDHEWQLATPLILGALEASPPDHLDDGAEQASSRDLAGDHQPEQWPTTE